MKSLKTVPKANGALSTTTNVADVIQTELKTGNNKKQPYTANKNKASANRKSQSNDNVATTTATPCAETRAVGDELLRCLQVNGQSIAACGNGITSSANKTNAVTNDGNHVPKFSDNSNCRTVDVDRRTDNGDTLHVNTNLELMDQCNGTGMVANSIDTNITKTANSSTDTTSRPNSQAPQITEVNAQKSQNSKTSTEPSSAAATTTSQTTTAKEPIQIEYHEMAWDGRTRRPASSIKCIKTSTHQVTFKDYENELQMPEIMRVIQHELSEPYSIYTYRYFIHNWPKLCFLAMDGDVCVGAIVCKLDMHRQMTRRGYIAMLAVESGYRKLKVGTTLVQKAIEVRALARVGICWNWPFLDFQPFVWSILAIFAIFFRKNLFLHFCSNFLYASHNYRQCLIMTPTK